MDPIPAATVVVVRDGPDGLETLLLRRGDTGSFGGMWVFPGGRVDPGDGEEELDAARRAAVREAEEEASLVFGEDDLVTYSHWVPPPITPKRFSTWFFLAAGIEGHDVLVDGGEIHDHVWVRPAEALARRDRGEIDLAPPTWVTLWELAAVLDVAAALDAARARRPERYETHLGRDGDTLIALWHGDAGYDDGDAAKDGPRHRLAMLPDGWRYERTSR